MTSIVSTTTNIIAQFDNWFDLDKLIYFLKVTRKFHNQKGVCLTKDNKNEFVTGSEGEIVSASGTQFNRGVLRQDVTSRRKATKKVKRDIFKNSISGYLTKDDHVLHYKISRKTITLTGKIDTIDSANLIFDILAEQIEIGQYKLDQLSDSLRAQLWDWFQSSFKGELVYVDPETKVIASRKSEGSVPRHILIVPKKSPSFSKYWVELIKEIAYDCFSFEEASEHVEKALAPNQIFDGDLEMVNISLGMDGGCFRFPFRVNLQKLHELICQTEGIYSTYVAPVHSYVRIEIPCAIEEELKDCIRKKKKGSKDYVKFLVYSTGHTSCSGKIRTHNEAIYNFFSQFIDQNQDVIRLD